MPPRYAYWTILVDGQPTAFRAAMEEDLLPTFKRLQQKHPSAEMKWFQNGKLWASRLEAQEAMHERGERGRMGDKRQGGGFRDRKKASAARPEWKPKSFDDELREHQRHAEPEDNGRNEEGKFEWKPKGEFTPAPKRADRPSRSEWKPRGSAPRESKPDWKQKKFAAEGSESRRSAKREGGLEWKPKGEFTPAPKRDRSERSQWKPKGSFDRERPARRPSTRPRASGKLEWTPKSGHTGAKPAGAPEKRKWIPKEEYKKAKGIEARRDKNWRPGGEHKDPRQKYKDAKKAKWTKFKSNIRQRWEKKQGDRPPKKRRDEE